MSSRSRWGRPPRGRPAIHNPQGVLHLSQQPWDQKSARIRGNERRQAAADANIRNADAADADVPSRALDPRDAFSVLLGSLSRAPSCRARAGACARARTDTSIGLRGRAGGALVRCPQLIARGERFRCSRPHATRDGETQSCEVGAIMRGRVPGAALALKRLRVGVPASGGGDGRPEKTLASRAKELRRRLHLQAGKAAPERD